MAHLSTERDMKEDKLTPDGKVRHWVFHPSRPYFVHDPEGDGFSYFATEQERDRFANEAIQGYESDGWSEDVVFVMAGKITHRATQTDVVPRPPNDQLDGDGLDGEGRHWPEEWAYICNYKMLLIEP